MKEQLIMLLIPAILGATFPSALAGPREQAAACAAVKEEIREIEARMRAGYTRAQGEKYEARLRKLKAKRSKLCR